MLQSLPPSERLTTGRKLVVSLSVEPDGNPLVAACEVLGESYRNRTSWHHPRNLDEVFQPAMAEAVRLCLAELSGNSEVTSLPTLRLEQPGMLLSNAHLISSRTDTGALSVILRFKTFLGSLAEIFLPHVDLVSGAHAATLETADRIMMDISMPLLNFLSFNEAGGKLDKSDAERLMAQLIDQSHALRFQIELIKRHIARLDSRPKNAPRKIGATEPARWTISPGTETEDVAYVEARNETA